MNKKLLLIPIMILAFAFIVSSQVTSEISWTEVLDPAPYGVLTQHAMFSCFIEDKMYLVGGGGGTGDNNVYYANHTNLSDWVLVNATPAFTDRRNHRLLSNGTALFVIAGQNDSIGLLEDVWYSTAPTDVDVVWIQATATANFNDRRDTAGCVMSDNNMFISGGFGDDPDKIQDDVYKSPDGVVWTQICDGCISDREDHEMIAWDNGSGEYLWIVGGFDAGSDYYNNVIYSDDFGATWNTATGNAEFTGRSDFVLVDFSNRLWVMGGYDGSNYLNDTWYSDDGTNWTRLFPNTTSWEGRRGHTGAVCCDNITYIAGGDGGVIFDDLWSSNYTEPNTLPILIVHFYDTPSAICTKELAESLNGSVDRTYVFYISDEESNDIYVDFIHQYGFSNETESLENVFAYPQCFEDAPPQDFDRCNNATGYPLNWRSTLNHSDAFIDYGVETYYDKFIWSDSVHLDNYYELLVPYQMRDHTCWYTNAEGNLTRFTTLIENKIPVRIENYFDTGSPICIGENRTFHDFLIEDEENDDIYVRVVCQSRQRQTPSASEWQLYTGNEELEIECSYGNQTGIYTDWIQVTDAVNRPYGLKKTYDFIYEIRDINDEHCFETGEEGGRIRDDDEFYASESGFHKSGWNETFLRYGRGDNRYLDSYEPRTFDWSGKCVDWNIMRPACPIWYAIIFFLGAIATWIFSNFLWVLIILIVLIGMYMLKKKVIHREE